ncbi:hypothetical protein LSAT2_015868 [Lamellibrachia satsuma]|nr:hypothetical protein LSAT2_015868 [Lamellibrachia satsuma]
MRRHQQVLVRNFVHRWRSNRALLATSDRRLSFICVIGDNQNQAFQDDATKVCVSRLVNCSTATKYEARLLEQKGGILTEERTILVFDVFDKILPHLGVFQKVMEMCRDELFNAVYSDQLTGSHGPAPHYIQRVPYFVLVKQAHRQRNSCDEVLAEHLEVVKERLFEKQKAYEDLTEETDMLRQQVYELELNIQRIDDELAEKKLEIYDLKSAVQMEQEKREESDYKLACDLSDIKTNLDEAKSEVNFLQLYKSGYDNLYQAFVDEPGADRTSSWSNKGMIATRRSLLMSNVENANKLEEQLLLVQNTSVEEFDKFMEEHKGVLMKGSSDSMETDEDVEVEIDRADQQLLLTQERFKKNMSDLDLELKLLRQHKTMLLEQLQALEESRPEVQMKARENRRNSRPHTQESGLSAGLDMDDDDDDNPALDPFIPQERVFCKYAAMIYTSNNGGKNFHEFNEADYCPSCGEKTVLCPHKILSQEQVFSLPGGSTHIKIARPKVRLNHEILDPLFRKQRLDGLPGSRSLSPESKMFSRGSFTMDMMSPYLTMSKSPAESMRSASEDGGYPSTDGIHLERTISLIEQFAAFLFWEDEARQPEAAVFSILDNLYRFMRERYLLEEISYFAAYDLLSAIAEYSNTNKLIWLLAQVLVGNLDGAVFRYLLLMGDFIDCVSWYEAKDFGRSLKLSIPSSIENKISKTLVSEYIIYCIQRNREPRFAEMETKLLSQQGKANKLMELEFVEASDTVLPVTNDKLRRSLYREAEAYLRDKDGVSEGVPIQRLALLTEQMAYLGLLQMMTVIRDSVAVKVSSSSQRKESSESNVYVSSQTRSLVPAIYKLMTMSEVKTLGKNIAKCSACREERLRDDFDDDDF